ISLRDIGDLDVDQRAAIGAPARSAIGNIDSIRRNSSSEARSLRIQEAREGRILSCPYITWAGAQIQDIEVDCRLRPPGIASCLETFFRTRRLIWRRPAENWRLKYTRRSPISASTSFRKAHCP